MARKIRLDPEALAVESFRTVPSAEGARGTVRANQLTEPGSDSYGEETCGWTCGFDCDRTFELCYTLLDCPIGGNTMGGPLPGQNACFGG